MSRVLHFQVVDQFDAPLHGLYETRSRKGPDGQPLLVGLERLSSARSTQKGNLEELFSQQENDGGLLLMQFNHWRRWGLPRSIPSGNAQILQKHLNDLVGATFIDGDGVFNDTVSMSLAKIGESNARSVSSWIDRTNAAGSIFKIAKKDLGDRGFRDLGGQDVVFEFIPWGHQLAGKLIRSIDLAGLAGDGLSVVFVVRDSWKGQ